MLKKNHMLKDGSYNTGDFVYYFNNTVIFKSGKNEFKRFFRETLEEELKKFVVEWSENNKWFEDKLEILSREHEELNDLMSKVDFYLNNL